MGHEKSDRTERLHFHFSLSCIGEGNGNPLQCSCLENPRDGVAWWAAIFGVTQSRTRLKQLSSSSSSSHGNKDGNVIWAKRNKLQSYFTLKVKVAHQCPTLCDPMGYTVHGILQARILEWVAISFSNAWKWKGKLKSLSRVRLLATPWTAAHQGPPSMGFARQEYWSGVPLPSPTIVCIHNYVRRLFGYSSLFQLVHICMRLNLLLLLQPKH